jgi:hypothetical protein
LQLEGQPLKGLLLQHLVLAVISTTLVCLAGWIHFRAWRSSRPVPRFRLAAEFAGAIAIVLTAHLGGFLSGVNLP